MSFWAAGAAVVGAGASIYGAYQGSKAADAAAAGAQYTPYSVFGPGGESRLGTDPVTGERNVVNTLGAREQDMRGTLMSGAQTNLMGMQPGAQYGRTAINSGGSMVNPMYQQLMGQQYQSAGQAYNYGGIFGNMGNQNRAYGERGVNAAFGGNQEMGAMSGMAASLGAQYLDPNGSQSFNSLAAQRLSALRGAAQPQEEQMVNSKFNDLFSRGQLGTSGGAQGLQQLSMAQQMQDQSRITNSLDFAQQQSNQNQNLGMGLFGQAFSGYGNSNQYNLGLGALGSNMYSQGAGNYSNSLGAYQSGDQAQYSQGQNRLMAAQGMFGFGQQVGQFGIDQGLQQLGGAQSFDANLLQQASIGASVGQAQAQAGANAGALAMKAPNPWASIGAGISASAPAIGSTATQFFQNRQINSGLNAAMKDNSQGIW